MKLLAHYTIFGNEIFNLHTFEIENDIISHTKAIEETAHTAFVQGILIIAGNTKTNDIDKLNNLIAENKDADLRTLSEKIAKFIKDNGLYYTPNSKVTILTASYPDFLISLI